MALHKVAVAAKDGQSTPAAIPGGIRQHDESGLGTGPNDPMVVLVDSTGLEILGMEADAANPATDPTPISIMSVLKQISKSSQIANQPYNYTPLAGGQYNLAIASSTPLTVPVGALQAMVAVEGGSVRYTYDGTVPTPSVGFLLTDGQEIEFSGAAMLAALRFIQVAPTVTLNVGYTK